MDDLKYKFMKAEQRRVNQLLRRVNRWIEDCLSPEIQICQVCKRYDILDDLMYYKFSFRRGNVSRSFWAQEDLLNEYIGGALFDFIYLHAKDLVDKADFRLRLLSGNEFIWEDYGYRSRSQRRKVHGL